MEAGCSQKERLGHYVLSYRCTGGKRIMTETCRYSTQDVATYLTNRLSRDASGAEAGRKGRTARAKKAKDRPTSSASLEGVARERFVSEVADLALEKQDLLRQIVADGFPKERDEVSIGQDDLLHVLDRIDASDEAHLRSLNRLAGADLMVLSAAEEARKRLREVDERLKRLLADPGAAEAYRSHLEKKIASIRAARNIESLQRLAEDSELGSMRLAAKRNRANLSLSRADLEAMKKADAIAKKCREQVEVLSAREEVHYEVKKRGLLEYRRQLLNGGFVRTASVQKEIMRVLSHVQLGIPVFLRGHLGVGKTELALHVCRTYFGGEPEFVSGSEEATKYDIYGRTQIGVNTETERLAEFTKRMEEFGRMHQDATAGELREAQRQYYESIVVKGQTASFFQYGPLAKAMMEGRPLIIDEMDGIPHSILMRINHVLTRRPGDKVRVQENGGDEITVKPGFCVLATGNVKSARYRREELDAAFLSRWWSEDITYPPQNEMYEILVASLVDVRGSLQVRRPEDLDDLKRLTEAASEIQRIFMGDRLDFLGEGADAARGIPAGLKKSVLSLRNLWNIVRPWKAHNFDKPVEHYVLNEFIRPAVAEDQVYLVQLFCRFRFFKDFAVDDFEIPGLTEDKLLAFQGRKAAS
jgi:MoxR-like ATPase